MANNIAPLGFRPVRHVDGTPYNGSHQLFLVDSGDATAIGIGDLVKIAGDSGTAGQVVHGMNVEGMPTAILAVAGTSGLDLLGPVVGFLADPTAINPPQYRLASTSRVAMVCTDRSVIFECQEDAITTPIAHGSVGLNVAYTTTAVSTATGLSKQCIQSSTVATTATLPLKVIGLTARVGNAFNVGGSAVDPGTFDVMLNTGAYQGNNQGN